MNRAARLASVLRIRKLQESSARAHLVAAVQATRTATAQVLDRTDAYGEPDGPSGSHDEWLLQRASVASQAGAIVAARRSAAQLRDEEEVGLTTWQHAARRAAVVERLHVMALAQEAVAAARAEQAAADDLTLARMARRR